ncbi:MAG: YbjN domain-containing protein [Hyphomicrobiaceae bacterium]
MQFHQWRLRAVVAGLGLIALLSVGTATAQQATLQKFTREQTVEILSSEGYDNVKLARHADLNYVQFQKGGRTYNMYFFDDGDLQLYCLFRIKPPAARIGTWNREKRHSRAYLDADSEAVIESDMLGDAGLTREQIVNFVKVFMLSVDEFSTFLAESGKKKK